MRARLSVSLSAIQNNYRHLQTLCGDVPCAAVVKADAYGLGIEHVAPVLYAEGARQFFVALMEEGITLRGLVGNDAEIFVLNGLLPNETEQMLAHQLIPVLNNMVSIREWIEKTSVGQNPNQNSCAIQIDTGLNRLGLSSDEWINLDKSSLNIQLILSHLACADTPDNILNIAQRQRFAEAVALCPDIRASLAASDGIFCGADFHFDLVRPGAALYGINPIPNRENPMQHVVTLEAPVLAVREVEQDGTIGYAATRHVAKGQRLAAISIGYADGFFRSLSNQSHVFFQGGALPVLGRVSMDIIMVDISHLPENVIQAGDYVEILGAKQNADQLGQGAGTIGYEMLTSLGARFIRNYV